MIRTHCDGPRSEPIGGPTADPLAGCQARARGTTHVTRPACSGLPVQNLKLQSLWLEGGSHHDDASQGASCPVTLGPAPSGSTLQLGPPQPRTFKSPGPAGPAADRKLEFGDSDNDAAAKEYWLMTALNHGLSMTRLATSKFKWLAGLGIGRPGPSLVVCKLSCKLSFMIRSRYRVLRLSALHTECTPH